MKDKEIKVGDWVTVKTVGLTDRYVVESIEGDFYIVTQKEGTYVHRLTLDKNKVRKL
tara:strand:- start:126 stop:296 length:171 start_codon:yes stop_codon:yes gene_type:complete